jgi:hypothetical protein
MVEAPRAPGRPRLSGVVTPRWFSGGLSTLLKDGRPDSTADQVALRPLRDRSRVG